MRKVENMNGKKMFTAIGLLSDDTVMEVKEYLKARSMKRSHSLMWQFAPMAAGLVLTVICAVVMLRVFAPEPPVTPERPPQTHDVSATTTATTQSFVVPSTSATATTQSPVPHFTWLVEPNLDSWVKYCNTNDVFNAFFDTEETSFHGESVHKLFVLDESTLEPIGESPCDCWFYGCGKLDEIWLYDPALELFGRASWWWSEVHAPFEMFPVNEFAQHFPEAVNKLNFVQRVDSTIRQVENGSEYLLDEAWIGGDDYLGSLALAFGNEIVTPFIFDSSSNETRTTNIMATALRTFEHQNNFHTGVVNQYGVTIVPFEFHIILPICENTAFAKMADSNYWGIITWIAVDEFPHR
jgi:hypothetical protein